MAAKTKDQIVAKYAKLYGRRGESVYVYQFPKGHWSYATPASPIGVSLAVDGSIYPERRIVATQYEMVTI